MAGKKIAKSSLSEQFRLERAENTNGIGPAVDVYRDNKINMINKQWSTKRSPSVDVGSELQAIFSCKSEDQHCSVFGCSPPARAPNPLCRDYQFRRCILVNPNLSRRPSTQETVEIYAAVMPKI